MAIFSFLRTFYTHSTFSEKLFILNVSFMYGLIAPSLIGISVWFKAPHLLCFAEETGESVPCLDHLGCNVPPDYYVKIAEDSSPSLSATLGLLCEWRKGYLQSYFFGGILGCLSNIFVPIPSNKRKTALVFFGLVHAIANFSIVFNYNNQHYLQMSFGLLAFSLMILHSNCPCIIHDVFVGELAKAAMSICLMCWGLVGIFFALMSYINDADFHRGFTILGFLHLANSLHLIFVEQPEVHDHFVAKVNLYCFYILNNFFKKEKVCVWNDS